MACGPITWWHIDGETMETVKYFIFGLQNHGGLQPWNLKMLAPWKKSYDQPRQHIQKQRHYFANKSPSSQGYGFSSSHYGCESWTIRKAEQWRIDAVELWCWRRLLRVRWTKDIQPVHPKGNQSWLFIQRTDAEAETPTLWPLMWRVEIGRASCRDRV